jgi:glutathionyl-hydroquinone reductase
MIPLPALGCPWASRTLVARKLKGLDDVIDVAVTYYQLGEKGWPFKPEVPGCTPDPVFGAENMQQVYLTAEPDYSMRYTVPVLCVAIVLTFRAAVAEQKMVKPDLTRRQRPL